MDQAELNRLLAEKVAQAEAMRSAWPVLKQLFQQMRASAVEALVVSESEQMRGRIKALDEVISLPESVRIEMEALAQAQANPE
jgi:hypothetical protein